MEAVLNWLWQGIVIAIATAAIFKLITPLRAAARYRALWVALLSVLFLPGIAAIWRAVSATRVIGDIPVTATSIVSMSMSWWTPGAVVIDGFTLCGNTVPFVVVDDPVMVACAEVPDLGDDEEVVWVYDGREARAYPLRILDQREGLHDVLGGVPMPTKQPMPLGSNPLTPKMSVAPCGSSAW